MGTVSFARLSASVGSGCAMGYALRAGLSFCETGERLVFLDTLADRYFCLEEGVELAFRELLRGSGQVELSSVLQKTGLLVRTQMAGVPVRCEYRTVARESLLDAPATKPSRFWLLVVLIRLVLARRALKRGRFHRLLEELRAAKAPTWSRQACPVSPLTELAGRFEHTARAMRSHDQCLPRSIALARLAYSRGLAVDLVIGVRLHPFAAHCWVQSGQWLLNDRLDNTRTFTPIFVI